MNEGGEGRWDHAHHKGEGWGIKVGRQEAMAWYSLVGGACPTGAEGRSWQVV